MVSQTVKFLAPLKTLTLLNFTQEIIICKCVPANSSYPRGVSVAVLNLKIIHYENKTTLGWWFQIMEKFLIQLKSLILLQEIICNMQLGV